MTVLCSQINDNTICLIDIVGPWIHDFYKNTIDASAKLSRLGKPSNYIVGTVAEFEQMQRDKYLTGKVHVIDKEHWWEMLEILPPLRWERERVVETFMMSEFLVSSFTEQYGKLGDKYICKTVDYNDPSTHIKISDFPE